MNLYYNGVDILTNKNVILSKCVATDNASGEADSLNMTFADFSGLWGKWSPQFGDVIEAKKNGWTTGKMYIDDITDTDTSFVLSARSLPPKSRATGNTTWENVRFMEIASDLAFLSNLKLSTYDITDYEYVRFDRKNESPIATLNRLCLCEGYGLKVTDGKAIIYNEKAFENAPPAETIKPNKYEFASHDIGRNKIEIKWFNGELIQGGYSDDSVNTESETITDIPVYNVAQAQRWSKGILRNYNKNRHTGYFPIDQNLNLAAANVISTSRGNYFITKIKHELIGSKSYLWLRKPIEGDY